MDKLYCSNCGELLKWEYDDEADRYYVTPCERCLIENYREGREEGYEDGYSDGHDEGYEDGYSDGHDDGYQEGYNDGLQDG